MKVHEWISSFDEEKESFLKIEKKNHKYLLCMILIGMLFLVVNIFIKKKTKKNNSNKKKQNSVEIIDIFKSN